MTSPAPLRPACGAAPPVKTVAGALVVVEAVVELAKVVVPLATTVYVDVPETTTVLLAAGELDVTLDPEAAGVVVVSLALPELLTLAEDCEWLRVVEEPHELPDGVEEAEVVVVDALEETTLALALLDEDEVLDDEEELLPQLELARTENCVENWNSPVPSTMISMPYPVSVFWVPAAKSQGTFHE